MKYTIRKLSELLNVCSVYITTRDSSVCVVNVYYLVNSIVDWFECTEEFEERGRRMKRSGVSTSSYLVPSLGK